MVALIGHRPGVLLRAVLGQVSPGRLSKQGQSGAILEAVSLARPLYFPIKPEPLRMQAGLVRFGTDFGNGQADRLFFPRDESSPHYLDEKARVLQRYPARNAFSIRNE